MPLLGGVHRGRPLNGFADIYDRRPKAMVWLHRRALCLHCSVESLGRDCGCSFSGHITVWGSRGRQGVTGAGVSPRPTVYCLTIRSPVRSSTINHLTINHSACYAAIASAPRAAIVCSGDIGPRAASNELMPATKRLVIATKRLEPLPLLCNLCLICAICVDEWLDDGS